MNRAPYAYPRVLVLCIVRTIHSLLATNHHLGLSQVTRIFGRVLVVSAHHRTSVRRTRNLRTATGLALRPLTSISWTPKARVQKQPVLTVSKIISIILLERSLAVRSCSARVAPRNTKHTKN